MGWDTGPRMSDESDEFRGPGDWKAQANRVETPSSVWDVPEEEEAPAEEPGTPTG